MARQALKIFSLAAATSGVYLYGNKYVDPNDFGIIRVGRAIATVSFTLAAVWEGQSERFADWGKGDSWEGNGSSQGSGVGVEFSLFFCYISSLPLAFDSGTLGVSVGCSYSLRKK